MTTRADDPKTLEGLAQLVGRMRQRQVDYFKTRDRGVLADSKKLEREVDQAVKAVREGPGPLFGQAVPKAPPLDDAATDRAVAALVAIPGVALSEDRAREAVRLILDAAWHGG